MSFDPTKVKRYTTKLLLPIYAYSMTRWDKMIEAVADSLDSIVGSIKGEVEEGRGEFPSLSARADNQDTAVGDIAAEVTEGRGEFPSLGERSDAQDVALEGVALEVEIGRGEFESLDERAASQDDRINSNKLKLDTFEDVLFSGSTYKGGWDASTGVYPESPSMGDFYDVTTSGDILGTHYNRGSRFIYSGTEWIARQIVPSTPSLKLLTDAAKIELKGTTKGILIPDDTHTRSTPGMIRKYRFFIPEYMTEELTLYTNGREGIYLTTDKRIRINCVGIHLSEPIGINNEVLDLTISRDDNVNNSVKVMFAVNGHQIGATTVTNFSDLYLASLLDTTEGFFFVVDPGYAYTTVDATVRSQKAGMSIGMLREISRNGSDFTQSTAPARPKMGVLPVGAEVRNMLRYTNELDNWEQLRVATPVLLSNGYWKIAATNGLSSHILRSTPINLSAHRYTLQLQVKYAGSLRYVDVSFGGNPWGTPDYIYRRATIDLRDGVVVREPAGTGATTLERLHDGSFLVTLSVTGSNTSRSDMKFDITLRKKLDDNTTHDWFDDDGAFVLVKNPQKEFGAYTPYQEIGASPLYHVKEQGHYNANFMFLDGTDDAIARVTPEISNGTIVVAGTKGIWVGENFSIGAGLFSFGPSEITGFPSGALEVIGGIIGGILCGTALTSDAIGQIVSFYRSLGSPGWFEKESTNRVSNGTFDTDSDWDKGLLWSIQEGVATVTGSGVPGFLIPTVDVLVEPGTYIGEVETNSTNSAGAGLSWDGDVGVQPVSHGALNYRASGKASRTFTFSNSGAFSLRVRSVHSAPTFRGSVDNVSLHKITLNTGAYS